MSGRPYGCDYCGSANCDADCDEAFSRANGISDNEVVGVSYWRAAVRQRDVARADLAAAREQLAELRERIEPLCDEADVLATGSTGKPVGAVVPVADLRAALSWTAGDPCGYAARLTPTRGCHTKAPNVVAAARATMTMPNQPLAREATTPQEALAEIIREVLDVPVWDANTCAREIVAAGWAPKAEIDRLQDQRLALAHELDDLHDLQQRMYALIADNQARGNQSVPLWRVIAAVDGREET